MKIFFAGPLTNLKNPEATKAFYEKMDALAIKLGFETFWAFKSGTDPIKNPDITPKDVYARDIKALESSDIMVSCLTEPSTGTGMEIEHADEIGKPVVILYQKGVPISRMLRGSPAIKKEIVYETEDDALKQLSDFLTSLPH